MAFSGTMVVSGRATGLVVATGNETELGRINQLLTGVSALETPLLRQIKKFGYAITGVVAIVRNTLRLSTGRTSVPPPKHRNGAFGITCTPSPRSWL